MLAEREDGAPVAEGKSRLQTMVRSMSRRKVGTAKLFPNLWKSVRAVVAKK